MTTLRNRHNSRRLAPGVPVSPAAPLSPLDMSDTIRLRSRSFLMPWGNDSGKQCRRPQGRSKSSGSNQFSRETLQPSWRNDVE